MNARLAAPIIAALFFFSFGLASAAYQNTTMTWAISQNYYLTISANTARCFSSTGNATISAYVTRQPASGPYSPSNADANATVKATIIAPDQGQSTISLSSQGDGNYTTTHNFAQNGTYRVVLDANQGNDTNASQTTHYFAGNFSLSSYFLDNNHLYSNGESASVRTQLNAGDGNFVQAATARIDINYPNSASYASNQPMSEGNNGEYYYNFVAPSSGGTYHATASFECAGKTDSNSRGIFTVTGGAAPTISLSGPSNQVIGSSGTAVLSWSDPTGSADANIELFASTSAEGYQNKLLDLNAATSQYCANPDNDTTTSNTCSIPFSTAGLADGNYWIKAKANNGRTGGSGNSSAALPVVVDNTKPLLWDYNASNLNALPGTTITLRAKASDAHLSQANAAIRTLGGTIAQSVALYDDGAHNDSAAGDGNYANSWSTAEERSYTIDFNAVDSAGNHAQKRAALMIVIASAQSQASVIIIDNNVASAGPSNGIDLNYLASAEIRLDINLSSDQNNQSIGLASFSVAPPETTGDGNLTDVNEYRQVAASDGIEQSIQKARVEIKYDPGTVAAAGISDANLLVFKWNDSSQRWMHPKEYSYNGNSYGVQASRSIAWVEATSLSTYKLAGDESPPTITGTGPTSTQTSTSVVLTATTDEAAYCRYGTTSSGYEGMASQFSAGEESTSHSTTVTAQAGTNTYYMSCADLQGNQMASASSATFTVSVSQETAQAPSTPNVAPLGGGGGGTTAVERKEYDGKIISLDMNGEEGTGSKMVYLKVRNTGASSAYYLASVAIDTSAGQKSYLELEETDRIASGETQTIEFGREWVPAEKGVYTLKARLLLSQRNLVNGNPVQAVELDSKSETISMLPEERPDVRLAVECVSRVIRPGDDAQVEITMSNQASYAEQIALGWSITDPTKVKVEEDSISFEVPGKSSKTLPYVRTTSRDAALGPYAFGAVLSFEGRTNEDYCTFIVQSGELYYSTVVQVLKEDIAGLQKQANDLKARNLNVAAAEEKIRGLSQQVQVLEAKVSVKDYALFEQQAQQLFREVNASKKELGLAAEGTAPEGGKPFEFPTQWLAYAVAIIIVVAIAYFVAKRKPKLGMPKFPKKKEGKPPAPSSPKPKAEEKPAGEAAEERHEERAQAHETRERSERLEEIRKLLKKEEK